jgi:hypothetical protein
LLEYQSWPWAHFWQHDRKAFVMQRLKEGERIELVADSAVTANWR